jgi:hypothetical protein
MLLIGLFRNVSAVANMLERHFESWGVLTLLVGCSGIQCNVEDRTQHYRIICSVESEIIYIGFKTLLCVVRHLDSTASYLPTGLHLGFFASWPSLYLPYSFSSVFLERDLKCPKEIYCILTVVRNAQLTNC